MFYALDKGGTRISANKATKKEQYFCPICHNPVMLKSGLVNADHFAHEDYVCDDNWNYDMSKWHKRMQDNFSKEFREVVVKHNGKQHRADILIDDMVIEFQFSDITAAEFEERNDFFKNAGYRLAWVFNLSEVPDDKLYPSDDKPNMMIWKNPKRIFSNVANLGANNRNFALWFSYYGDQEYEENGIEALERVIWAIKDDEDCYSMKRFITLPYQILIDGEKEINPNRFFYSREDYFREILDELKSKHAYSVKYSGEQGKAKESYICPKKAGAFGIQIWGEYGCSYCKYCYMIAKKETRTNKKYAAYCCYPKQVQESSEGHPGYECSVVNIYEL